jgi:acetylornithine deacetylase/succinyl-diaminopimelate desuccinylase-like protein
LPTLDVNGMSSGYTDEGPKTIIPAQASAKISMRLVPNQTSKEIEKKFIKYIKNITPDYVNLTYNTLSTGEPIIMDKDSDFFKKAENAMNKTFGNKPIYELSGGSIPVTAALKHVLEIDSIMMGFGLPDDGLHSPNEKISLDMFYKGIETAILFFKSF